MFQCLFQMHEDCLLMSNLCLLIQPASEKCFLDHFAVSVEEDPLGTLIALDERIHFFGTDVKIDCRFVNS